MNDDQLLRYSRHLMLSQIDYDGQQKLLNSHVAIFGLGGLGSPVAMYLAASGIGRLTLIDDDVVELSNLQRQIIHAESTIGQTKVDSAASRLKSLNHDCHVNVVPSRMDKASMASLIDEIDVVVDCTDNFASRFLLNEVKQELKKPLVSGAAIRMEGQVTVYDARQAEGCCYHCLYENTGELQESCSETGVLAPLLGVIGSIQAIETIKLLTGTGTNLANRLLIFDAVTLAWREIKLKKNPNCPVCH
jgi:adenylyltransferase/sulfurtransferase